jgi:hypothetical protein
MTTMPLGPNTLKDEKIKKIKCDIKEEKSPGFMKKVTK